MEPKKFIKKITGFNKSVYGFPSLNERPILRYIMEIPTSHGSLYCSVYYERPGLPFRNRRVLGTNMSPHPIQIKFRTDTMSGDDYNEIRTLIENWMGSVNVTTSRRFHKNIRLRALDPTGITVEDWDLRNCFPSAYIINEDGSFEITLRYDHFRLLL